MHKLSSEKKFRFDKFFLQWEWGLVLLFIIINVINSTMSPHYFNLPKLVTITRSFLDKAFIVLPMCMVLLLGEIDISVGSTLALSSAFMALSHQVWGIPMVALYADMLNGWYAMRHADRVFTHRIARIASHDCDFFRDAVISRESRSYCSKEKREAIIPNG